MRFIQRPDVSAADVMFMQIVAALTIVLIVVLCAWLGETEPTLAALLASLASSLIGKFFGEPLKAITLEAVSKLPPPMAALAAKRAIESLPPDARRQLAQANVVLTGLSKPPPPSGEA